MDRRFSLAGLMRVRELQEERAAAELARANKVRRDAADARDILEHELAQHSFPGAAPADVLDATHAHALAHHAPTWRAVAAARASATAMLRESSQALAMANVGVDVATEQWTEAKMRAAMIEKLKARHDRALAAEDLREEQIVLDETALRRSLEVHP